MGLVAQLLKKLEIKHKTKEYKSKLRLEVLGTSKNLLNLINFKKSINFYDKRKKQELANMIKVYSNPRDERQEIEKLVFKHISKNTETDVKSMMFALEIKYTFLKDALNFLLKEKKIEKFEQNKIIRFKAVS